MTIKEDWLFQLKNKDTKEITCSVLFRIADSNRKVNINTTGVLICEIKRWIKIYKVLTSHNYITGCYDDMWEWNKSIERNKLSYLATRLKQKRILGNHCHKELSNYIPDPKPNSKKPLKNITEISSKAKKIIDDIVDEIIR